MALTFDSGYGLGDDAFAAVSAVCECGKRKGFATSSCGGGDGHGGVKRQGQLNVNKVAIQALYGIVFLVQD